MPFDWIFQDQLALLNQKKLSLLNQGLDILDFSMINPISPPDRFLLDKLVEAEMNPKCHRYSVSRGIRKLREAFAFKYQNTFKVNLDPESNICITMGSKDAVLNTLMACTKPGNSVLIAKPYYPAHLSALRLCGLKPVFFELHPSSDQTFKSILNSLELSKNISAALINFPSNPLGSTLDQDFFRDLSELAIKSDFFVINDFVYGEMGFESSTPPSLLVEQDLQAPLVEVYSMSKAYNIPGWRVGALLGNPTIVQRLAKLKSHIDYGIHLPIQIAAAAGLTSSHPIAKNTVRAYYQRLNQMMAIFDRLGWHYIKPQAGCSLFVEIPSSYNLPSLDMAQLLLEKAHIFALPGSYFGKEGYLRFALVEAIEKFQKFEQNLQDFCKQPQKFAA